MTQWNYLLASISVSDVDRASGILWSLGTVGIEELDSMSGRRSIRAYFSPADNIRALRKQFATDCRQYGIHCYSLSLKQQEEMDWLKKWREHLAPFPIGAQFFVIPDPSKRVMVPAGRIPLYLEPGMAFGTGSHETTQLCIESLESELAPKSHCFDIGTGSGILAIVAAKLGARKVSACDMDPLAIQIAKANGSKNRCASQITWVLGEAKEIGRTKCDLLVANLTFEIIQQELVNFESRLKKGATLILSGLLKEQADNINDLIKTTRLVSKARKDKGEWSCLIYKKHLTRR